ncbi:MAG: DUF177 domain-containing protein [Myxococcales bacterium]|nr:DUF177 domain-containing protein [Myxococcales bacterium]
MPTIQAFELGLSITRPLQIQELPNEGLHYGEKVSETLLSDLLEHGPARGSVRFHPEGPADLDIEVVPATQLRPGTTTQRPTIRIHGHVELTLNSCCVRCLCDVRPRIHAPVEITLHPDKDPLEGIGTASKPSDLENPQLESWDEETFPQPEALDEDSYQGTDVFLLDIVREAIQLALPSSPTCKDTDACDLRTQQLIREANAEIEASNAEGDPRWAALRALKREIDETNHGGGTGNH